MNDNGRMNINEETIIDPVDKSNDSLSVQRSGENDSRETDDSHETKNEEKKNGLWYWVRDIAIAVALALILLQFVSPTMVRQESMMNTLHDGDYIFINKQAYNFGQIEHGDIIVFQTDELDENGKEKKLIKRAIALPGDTLEITGGKVYLNDEEIYEPYLKEQYTDGEIERTVVPDNKVFAMGDNRAYSHDSREPDLGFIDMDDLKGQAIFRIFPFGDIGIIK